MKELKRLSNQLVRPFPLPLKYSHDKKVKSVTSWIELRNFFSLKEEVVRIFNYKGLGEMNAEQLWETTIQPSTRQFLQVTIEDAMGSRQYILNAYEVTMFLQEKEFIEANALNVRNLDT